MRGIIYVAHGSQKSGKNQKMQLFFEALKAARTEERQALAFLEKHPDTLEETARQMVMQGVTELLVVPLLLFSAVHKEEDIPQQLRSLAQDIPELSILICPTFGQEEEVMNVLLENLKKCLKDNQLVQPEILLIAHGSSSYQQPARVVEAIGHYLSHISGLTITTGFLYGDSPYLEQVPRLLKEEQGLLILPFFLFDGHLLDKIKAQIDETIKFRSQVNSIYYADTLNLEISLTAGILRLIEQKLSFRQTDNH